MRGSEVDGVIHRVAGSVWNGGRNKEEQILVELAVNVSVHTINRFLQDNQYSFDLVEGVLFDAHTEAVYEAEVNKLYKNGIIKE